ncbi:MAG: hypothetical protein Q9216_002603 [Gyalolechia sp. 2 TL-2023]
MPTLGVDDENMKTRESILQPFGERRKCRRTNLRTCYACVRRRAENPQYTRQFSLGNGPDEWVQDYLINRESGKMLGTLVALALARMPNLESFVWDMPTGILRDCWLALASLSDGKDSRDSNLEKIWVRFHNNRAVLDNPEISPTAPQSTHHSSGPSSSPSYTHSSNNPQRQQPPRPIEWSYRHIEHPNFSILPPLRSLNVLNIDEIAYLEELSVLLERSANGLRELRIGLAATVPRDGFASTRDLDQPVNDAAPTEYQDALRRLMGKIYQVEVEKCRKDVDCPSKDRCLVEYSAQDQDSTVHEILDTISVHTVGTTASESTSTQVLQGDTPISLPKALLTSDPANILNSPVVKSGSTVIDTPVRNVTHDSVSQATLNASEEVSAPYQVLKQGHVEGTQDDLENPYQAHQVLLDPSGPVKRLRLELLELERVDLDIPVLRKTIDWSFVTTLTLLHCDSQELLWKAFRRTFTPQQSMSQPILRRKSKLQLQNFSSLGSSAIPPSEYRMKLRRIHTNTVSSALIAFLKETLAPNSLEYLFLQDGGVVLGPSGERGHYDSNVSAEAICRGPLRRHRSSIQKLMIDSGDQGHGRRQKWQKWKFNREILLYLTSGKMSALREVAFSLDYKDWHVFLQRMPQVPHIRSIHIPHIADHPYGHQVNAKELALQMMDIVTIRPEMELCYLGISNKCFEILEGAHDDLENISSSMTAAHSGPDDAISTDDDSDDNDEDQTPSGNTSHPLAGDDSDSEGQDDSAGDSDDELARSNNGIKRPCMNLREILFYEDRCQNHCSVQPNKYSASASSGEAQLLSRPRPIMSSRRDAQATSRPEVFSLARLFVYAFISLPLLRAAPLRNGPITAFEEAPMAPSKPTLWIYLAVAIALVLIGGAFAGLTIALMGQDEIYLQVIKTSGEGAEKKHAAKVLTLLKRGKHWVLVTLLLGNVITNETLPIVLDRSLGGGWPAVLGSTNANGFSVIFGEIIPQSICVRYGLPIGAHLSPLVLVLMYILGPVAWPTAKLLDRLLGEDHGTTYKKAGLKTLVTLHKSLGAAGEQLNSDEVTIISAVLDLKAKPIGSIMTPIKDVFTMSSDTILDEKTMDVILGAGYSRIPIHEPGNPQNYVGMLLVKILITYDPEDCKKVNEFALATLPETAPETSCLDIVNFFQEGKSHMVLVSDQPGQDSGAIGVVTLEDVIEELIGEEIIDESDVYIDVHKAIRRTNLAPKTRIGKHGVVAEPESNMGEAEENLIDIGDDSKPHHKALQRTQTHNQVTTANGSTLNSTPASGRNAALRRTSSIASVTKDGQPKPIGNLDHFRNLGPSNLASRPRQTRYNTVKIKPGGGNLTEHLIKAHDGAPAGPPLAISTASPAPHGGVGTGILNSAGKDASDGVLAVQQGYGTMTGTTPPKSAGKASGGGPSAASRAASSAVIPEEQEEPPNQQRPQSRPASSPHHSDSESTIGSLQKKHRHSRPGSRHHTDASPLRKRGTARSGSITENIIDMGGIKKVVLETTSSSEEANASKDNGTDTHSGNGSGSGSGKGHEEGNDGGVPLNEQGPDGAEEGKTGQKSGGGRKKRRRKTRKGGAKGKGEGEESAPLLDGEER